MRKIIPFKTVIEDGKIDECLTLVLPCECCFFINFKRTKHGCRDADIFRNHIFLLKSSFYKSLCFFFFFDKGVLNQNLSEE